MKAKNLFEVLLGSSEFLGRRLNQLINCLQIFFDCPINDLWEEYNGLKNMIDIVNDQTAPYVKANYGEMEILEYARSTYNYRVSNFSYSNVRIGPKCLLLYQLILSFLCFLKTIKFGDKLFNLLTVI